MSEGNFLNWHSHPHRSRECAIYNVDVSGRNLTAGIEEGEPCGLLESLIVSREPTQNNVMLSFDYEESKGNCYGLTHRWFCLSLAEARRLAVALLNAVETGPRALEIESNAGNRRSERVER